jgi:hypothetical protein
VCVRVVPRGNRTFARTYVRYIPCGFLRMCSEMCASMFAAGFQIYVPNICSGYLRLWEGSLVQAPRRYEMATPS